jgi:hypothetical protein
VEHRIVAARSNASLPATIIRTYLLKPFLVLTAIVQAGCADMGNLVIFSAVEGQIMNEGRPVSGATISRSWVWPWGKENNSDSATTDQNGRFSLPEISRSSLMASILPHEPNIYQKITVNHANVTTEIWENFKHSYKPGSETDAAQPQIRVSCEITSEPTQRGRLYGRCVPLPANTRS